MMKSWELEKNWGAVVDMESLTVRVFESWI